MDVDRVQTTFVRRVCDGREQHLFHHPLVDQWVGSDCE